MKKLAETKALDELRRLKTAYRSFIKTNYEHRAADCRTCPTKGVCCLDAHFVNVHVTKLEAAAIRRILGNLSEEKQREVYGRAAETIEKYNLETSGDTFLKTFACPLFEKGVGCLVHFGGKPTPCISHACYENVEDLPPEKFQENVENEIEKLNRKTYGDNVNWMPLPVWLGLVNPFRGEIKVKEQTL